jgi:uncharacterized protein (DUF58 family)
VAGAGLVILGVMSDQRDVIWPGAFLILLSGGAALLLWVSTRDLSSRRVLFPDQVQAGDPVRVDLTLGHRGSGLGGVHVVEETVTAPVGEAPVFVVPSGWGRAESVHRYQLRPPQRGRYHLGPLMWRSSDALGLAVRQQRQDTLTPLTVTPRVVPLRTLQHSSGVGLTGDSALLRSSLIGPDDALIREYRPRDDVRRIHWPSTARTGTMMVRREERAWDPSAIILLDSRAVAHRGSGPDSTFEWAVSAAASIGVHLLDAGFDLNVVEADGRAFDHVGRESSGGSLLLHHLTDSALAPETSLDRASAAVRRRTGAPLLVAILGRLSYGDAITLTRTNRDRRLSWAIVLDDAADDQGPAGSGEGCSRLRADGWQVAPGAAAGSILQAWATLESGVAR